MLPDPSWLYPVFVVPAVLLAVKGGGEGNIMPLGPDRSVAMIAWSFFRKNLQVDESIGVHPPHT